MIEATIPIQYPKEVVISYYENVQTPLFIGIDGPVLTDSNKQTLKEIRPSGVIIMRGNVQNKEQLKKLIQDIHDYGRSLGINIKVAIDEEGSVVSRLAGKIEGFASYEGIHKYAKYSSKQLTFKPSSDEFQIELDHAKNLKDLGIDINFAPVVDVAYNSNSIMELRSGGRNPNDVAFLGVFITALHRKEGVESTLKHFPGHGRTSSDSHEVTPVINISKEQWLNSDAIPFKQHPEYSDENEQAYYIMSGHIIYPQIDSQPATISKVWLKDILRKELNFKGEIITDDLKMGGLENITPNNDQSWLYKASNTSNSMSLQKFMKAPENKSFSYAAKIKLALDAGNNKALLILNEQEMSDAYQKWLTLEKTY